MAGQQWTVRTAAIGIAALVTLDDRTAVAQWQSTISGAPYSSAVDVAVDAGDDVVAAGSIQTNGDALNDFALVKLSGATGGELWRYVIVGENTGYSYANAVAVDTAGDVVAAGELNRGSHSLAARTKFAAVKVSGTTGTELWRYEIPAASGNRVISPAFDVALAGATQVVVAGQTQNDPNAALVKAFTVVKLAAANGSEIWRRDVVGTTVGGVNAAWTVGVDSAGDVLAAGYTDNVSTGLDFTVVKLAGSDGAELWRYVAHGTGIDTNPNDADTADYDSAYTLAFDGADNVYAGGFVENSTTRKDLIAVKLAAADGSELWRRELGICAGVSDVAASMLINADGDAFVAGSMRLGVAGDAAVVKLGGTDGSVLWEATIDGTASESDLGYEIELSSAGDVVLVGTTDNSGSGDDITLVKLAGSDGAELWRQVIDGGGEEGEYGQALALDGAGDVIGVGTTNYFTNFTVVKVSDVTPDPKTVIPTPMCPPPTPTPTLPPLAPDLVKGTKFFLKDRDGAADLRKLVLLARDAAVMAPIPGSLADPTTGGGELKVVNPSTNEAMTIALPENHWRGIGDPPGSRGYDYADAGLVDGPCKKVSIRPKKLKALCRGSGITFSLDELSQGSLAIRLRSGGTAQPQDYCMRFGGTVIKDTQAAGGSSGVFKAADANPPFGCVSGP
jgi:hypothetical protein